MSDELREALTASGATALIPKEIDPFLQEQVRRYSPLLRSIPSKKWDTNTFFFNTRTAVPRGKNVVDGGAVTATTSTYAQSSFNIALFQVQGGVTGFAQAVTRGTVGDLLAKEQEGAMMSQTWDLENAICWGNSAATALGQNPQHDSLDSQINTYSGGSQNAYDVAGTVALTNLDTLIGSVSRRAAMPVSQAPWMFVMSPDMKLKVEALLTNQQRFMGDIEVAAGLRVPTYKGVPIVESSFVSSLGNAVPAITLAAGGTGGTLSTATYYYQLGAVMGGFGDLQASAEVSQAVTSGQKVTITVTAPSGIDGASVQLYKVFRATTTGAETLVGVTDAADTTGAAITTIVDTGANLLLNGLAQGSGTGPAAYVGACGQKPRGATDEDIFLIPRDENYLVRPVIRDLEMVPLARTSSAPDTLPFAILTDQAFAIRGAKYTARLSRVRAS